MSELLAKEIRNNQTPKLCFREVSFKWPSGEKALDRCSFSIPGPGLWMIVGSNGSGKSTLFRIISGLLKPEKGQIECQHKIALMFQNPDHQILLPTCGSELLLHVSSKLTIQQSKKSVEEALEQVGLAGMQFRPIHTLSGGQKQRLALAGALASESTLLLLDEPTALLDPISQTAVLKIVKSLCHSKNKPLTALWITHKLEELEHADGANKMEKGRLGTWENGRRLMNRLKPLAVRRV